MGLKFLCRAFFKLRTIVTTFLFFISKAFSDSENGLTDFSARLESL